MSNVNFKSARKSSYLLSFSFASVWIRAENVIGQLMACVMRWNDFPNSIDFIPYKTKRWNDKRGSSVLCKLSARLIDALGIGNLYMDIFQFVASLFRNISICKPTPTYLYHQFAKGDSSFPRFVFYFIFYLNNVQPWAQTTGK